MEKTKITWYVDTSEGLIAKKEHHAGTYSPRETLKVVIQVWNNRWGVEEVEPLKDAVVNIYFDTIEDSALLNLCSLEIDEMGKAPITIRDQKASARIGRDLSGKANDGVSEKTTNRSNFVTLTFSFDASKYRVKENDLKSLHFEIISSN